MSAKLAAPGGAHQKRLAAYLDGLVHAACHADRIPVKLYCTGLLPPGERKSIEGAAVFFLTAFLCIHVPVLLWGGTGRLESLLIAVAVGSMVMLAEAAAWWGIDNLIIPLWGYMTLKSLLAMDAARLWSQLGFLASLGAFTWTWRRRTSLGDDALAGTVLWGYVVWAVGGFVWVLAPLLQLATYATITVRSPLDRLRGLSFPVVLANSAGAMFWLLVYRQEGDPALFLPFAVCYGVNVAIIALVRAKYAFPALARLRVLSLATASGMLIVLPSLLVAYGLSFETLAGVLAARVGIAAATEVFIRIQPGLEGLPIDTGRWLRQASLAALGSAAALGLFPLATAGVRAPVRRAALGAFAVLAAALAATVGPLRRAGRANPTAALREE